MDIHATCDSGLWSLSLSWLELQGLIFENSYSTYAASKSALIFFFEKKSCNIPVLKVLNDIFLDTVAQKEYKKTII